MTEEVLYPKGIWMADFEGKSFVEVASLIAYLEFQKANIKGDFSAIEMIDHLVKQLEIAKKIKIKIPPNWICNFLKQSYP